MIKKILFIGNSYTYYHNMPEEIFSPLANSSGIHANVRSVTHGGYKLDWFADQRNEEGKRLRETIHGSRYDCIVLQDHSLITIVEPERFFHGIGSLKELLKNNAERFVLYATWGRKPGCETLAELNMSSGEMTQRIAAAYDEAGRRYDMTVAHVGKAFASYARKHPDAELYAPDLHHPSLLGSTIAAQTILDAVMRT